MLDVIFSRNKYIDLPTKIKFYSYDLYAEYFDEKTIIF